MSSARAVLRARELEEKESSERRRRREREGKKRGMHFYGGRVSCVAWFGVAAVDGEKLRRRLENGLAAFSVFPPYRGHDSIFVLHRDWREELKRPGTSPVRVREFFHWRC